MVLAGGRSSRMGSSKAALEWHGSTLLRRTVSVVGRAVDGPVVVVGAPGQPLPTLPSGVEVLTDPHEGLGPLQGIAVGLAAVADRADTAFVSSTGPAVPAPGLRAGGPRRAHLSGRRGLARCARLPAAPHRCLSHLAGADGRRSRGRGPAATGVPVPGVSRAAARGGRTPGRPRGRGARPRAGLGRQRQRGAGLRGGQAAAVAGDHRAHARSACRPSGHRTTHRPRRDVGAGRGLGSPLAGPPGPRRCQRPARRRGDAELALTTGDSVGVFSPAGER